MATSKPLPATPVQAQEQTLHSTLEVDYERLLENDSQAAPIVGQDPQYEKVISCTDVGKQAVISYHDVGKQAIVTSDEVDDDAAAIGSHNSEWLSLRSAGQGKILGLRRKTFLVSVSVLLALMIVGAVSGGVGGTAAMHSKVLTATVSHSIPSPTIRAQYANTGLAAMQYTDFHGTLYKRLYYQDNSNKIRESAWDNSTAFDTQWQIHPISDAVKPGTPIAAAAGYPHASYNYSLVKNVYFMSTDDGLFARQAPSNNSQAWVQDNFSGLYSGSNSTFLTVYWTQDIQNKSQVLVVLFQGDKFANCITQGRYTSNSTASNPWVANNFGFSQPQGSTFAMAPVSYRSGKHLMLYTVDDGNKLQQHEYRISESDLDSTTIVSLISEACFLDHTPEIEPLQKPNTTFLSLAATSDRVTGDGNLYIMFDSGSGPQVEEWTVPKHAGDQWVTSRNVTVDFGL